MESYRIRLCLEMTMDGTRQRDLANELGDRQLQLGLKHVSCRSSHFGEITPRDGTAIKVLATCFQAVGKRLKLL